MAGCHACATYQVEAVMMRRCARGMTTWLTAIVQLMRRCSLHRCTTTTGSPSSRSSPKRTAARPSTSMPGPDAMQRTTSQTLAQAPQVTPLADRSSRVHLHLACHTHADPHTGHASSHALVCLLRTSSEVTPSACSCPGGPRKVRRSDDPRCATIMTALTDLASACHIPQWSCHATFQLKAPVHMIGGCHIAATLHRFDPNWMNCSGRRIRHNGRCGGNHQPRDGQDPQVRMLPC
jgi:hypothetical protein